MYRTLRRVLLLARFIVYWGLLGFIAYGILSIISFDKTKLDLPGTVPVIPTYVHTYYNYAWENIMGTIVRYRYDKRFKHGWNDRPLTWYYYGLPHASSLITLFCLFEFSGSRVWLRQIFTAFTQYFYCISFLDSF